VIGLRLNLLNGSSKPRISVASFRLGIGMTRIDVSFRLSGNISS
jgi:hypothetical protein